MTPIEVLKMLKRKIDEAKLNRCNYVIEADDMEAIEKTLSLYDVNESYSAQCDVCGCHPSIVIRTEFGTFCREHARYIR